ncbi:MAG: hypothetical protein V9F04_16855 [Dermatophilaceae bacterium]
MRTSASCSPACGKSRASCAARRYGRSAACKRPTPSSTRCGLALSGDPLATWQLAVYFHDLGVYDLAIRAARQVVDLAGVADSLQVPVYILRLRYPAAYSALVVNAANTYAVHPFVDVRQDAHRELLLEVRLLGRRRARAQPVHPHHRRRCRQPTGPDRLRLRRPLPPGGLHPHGARITSTTSPSRPAAGRRPMLAGYYAGPANAGVWLDLAKGDVDLFVEVIRLPDAKGYVTTTFEYFEEYRVLYGQ